MAIAAGLPMPQLFVIPDADPNAFATGRDPEHASIAVTNGLLDALSREELQGVVAHEMSHVRNFDIRLMTVVAALVGAVVLLSDFIRRWMFWGGGKRGGGSRDKGRRRRRRRADGGVGDRHHPGANRRAAAVDDGVAAPRVPGRCVGGRAHAKPARARQRTPAIEFAVEPTKSIKRGTANLCIADPLGRKIDSREGTLADLFASHPPMVKRIGALREMAYQPPQG